MRLLVPRELTMPFWVLQVIEGQTKLVLRDPEIYDAPFHSFSVVPDVTQSGDQSSRCAFL